jgi:hypothetical protein
MKRILLLTILLASPAMADGFPDQPIADPGKMARPKVTPTKVSPKPADSGVMIDGEGQRYTAQDVKYGFAPVPAGMTRSGGGFVRVWNGAPVGFVTNGVGSMAYAVMKVQQQNDPIGPQLSPNLPKRPENPDNPDNPNPPKPPINTPDVPGPLGIGSAGVLFVLSRKLRQRIKSCVTFGVYNG